MHLSESSDSRSPRASSKSEICWLWLGYTHETNYIRWPRGIDASFIFFVVFSFYGESLGGRGFVTVLITIALQVPSDRARGELPSDARTLIFRGKIGEIWRSGIVRGFPLVSKPDHSHGGIFYSWEKLTSAPFPPLSL